MVKSKPKVERDRATSNEGRVDRLQRAVVRIFEAVYASADLQDLFRLLHGIVNDLIPAANFYIALYDADSDTIRYPYYVDEKDPPPAPEPCGRGLTGYVIRTGEPLLASPEVFNRLVEAGEVLSLGAPSVDWLGVPLKKSDQSIMGAVVAQTYTEGVRYSQEDRDILSFVSAQIALAIERAHLVEALRQSEEKYRGLSNQLPLGVYRTRADGQILFANAALAAIMEYDSVDAFMRTSALRAYTDEGQRRIQLQRWKESDGVVSTELQFITAKGRRIWVRDTGRVILDDKGEIEYIDGIIEDITARKATHEALRESETTYRNLFATMAQGVVYWDDAGRVISANPAAERILGMTAADMGGLEARSSLFRFVREDGEDFPDHERPVRAALDTGKAVRNVPMGFVHPQSGRISWINVHAVPEFRKGETRPFRVFTTFEDISERKKAETIQNVLFQITRTASLNISLHHLLERIQKQVNRLMDARNFYVAMIQDRERSLYTFPFIVDVVPDEMVAPGIPVDLSGGFTDHVLRTGKPLLADRRRFRELLHRNRVKLIGTEATSWLGVPLITAGGDAMGVMVVQSYDNPDAYRESDRDVLSIVSNTVAWAVTLNQAESEKRDLEEKLVRAEKMEALGRLAGGVAHDLNNVLSGMVSYPDLMLQEMGGDHKFAGPIQQIKKSGQKAAAIVEDLLTLARRGVPVREVIHLNEVIIDYLKSPEFKKLCEFHPQVSVDTDLHAELFNIMGSRIHIGKTVMNLVSNAAEAMPQGGSVRIETRNCYVDRPKTIYDLKIGEGEYVVLKVSDAGVGMPQEDLKKIFEPFYTKKVMGRSGTGLGMAVVWGTVKDHRGHIHVHSTRGTGTVFEIYLPVTREKIARSQAEVRVDSITGAGEHILVVDDVEEQRQIARDLLSHLGYRVFTCPSGESAIDSLRSRRVDLVLLDMIMDPGMDGLETLKSIREMRPDQPVVIVSGFSENERIQEAQKMGGISYVKKPYTLHTIGTVIRERLGRKKKGKRR